MRLDIHDARRIKWCAISPVERDNGSVFYTRVMIVTGRMLAVDCDVEVMLYADREDDLLLPHELDERVMLADRAAHDDAAEAALAVNS